MERKIGEIFEYNGEWYQCVKKDSCRECDFFNTVCATGFKDDKNIIGECSGARRDQSVVFKKLEKVGEPFSCNYYGDNRQIMMQEYKAYDNRIIPPNGIPMYVTDEKHKRVAIEIKQNEKAMEEKKLNLKPFSLEQAKAGKPVCTRDGRKARIICFDAEGGKPLIVLSKIDGKEVILRYTEKGQSDYYHSPTPREDDLMMLPEKKEGWVNICKDAKDDDRVVFGCVFESREDAVEAAPSNDRYITIATVRIEWEE